jgi:hypothetical protein
MNPEPEGPLGRLGKAEDIAADTLHLSGGCF